MDRGHSKLEPGWQFTFNEILEEVNPGVQYGRTPYSSPNTTASEEEEEDEDEAEEEDGNEEEEAEDDEDDDEDEKEEEEDEEDEGEKEEAKEDEKDNNKEVPTLLLWLLLHYYHLSTYLRSTMQVGVVIIYTSRHTLPLLNIQTGNCKIAVLQ